MSLFHKKQKNEQNVTSGSPNSEWIPDHKRKNCMLCAKEFSMFNRRHHCRKCGGLVCGDCSKNEWYIESPSGQENKIERVCDSCFHDLENHHPVTPNPHFQVLTAPNFFSWIATFEKSWIRSRYPNKYNKYKRQLLKKDCCDKQDKNQKDTKPKPSNATIKSKLTPKALEKRRSITIQQQPTINRKSSTGSNQSEQSKPKYQRPQKEKYQHQQHQQSQNKKSLSMPQKVTLKKKKKKKWNPLIVVQTGVLYVNIMEAQGLPDCDTFSQPDGYCIFYVTNNDPCFGDTTKYSTKVQHNTVKLQKIYIFVI